MKQFLFVLMLTFIISISNIDASKLKKKQVSLSNFSRQGNMTISDVGASPNGVWICPQSGEIMKFSNSSVQMIIASNITDQCVSLDVDYNGLPWVVTNVGDVWRLKLIIGNSYTWMKIYSASSSTPKAIDIGCGLNPTSTCYIAITGQPTAFAYNGVYFVTSDYNLTNPILRLDVSTGVGGDVIVAIDNTYTAYEIVKGSNATAVGMIGVDVTVGSSNQIYIINHSRISNIIHTYT